MTLSIRPMLKIGTLSKSTLLKFGFIAVLGLGFLSYLDSNSWQRSSSDMFSELPAAIFPAQEATQDGEGANPQENNAATNEIAAETDTAKREYVEEAKDGEGITHLARRALKGYLTENSQPFMISPEHKIYIEDYIAKKMGDRGLELGEKLEFSGGLLNEAVQSAEKLSSEQLKNLTQFSQAVPALNY